MAPPMGNPNFSIAFPKIPFYKDRHQLPVSRLSPVQTTFIFLHKTHPYLLLNTGLYTCPSVDRFINDHQLRTVSYPLHTLHTYIRQHLWQQASYSCYLAIALFCTLLHFFALICAVITACYSLSCGKALFFLGSRTSAYTTKKSAATQALTLTTPTYLRTFTRHKAIHHFFGINRGLRITIFLATARIQTTSPSTTYFTSCIRAEVLKTPWRKRPSTHSWTCLLSARAIQRQAQWHIPTPHHLLSHGLPCSTPWGAFHKLHKILA